MSADPRPQVSTLDNGLQLVFAELPHARSVSISIYLRAGQRYEAAPEDAGISHFVEHLCFKGTERRPGPRLVAAEIDGLGGSINAATDRELTSTTARSRPTASPRRSTCSSTCCAGSQCRDEEIERERGVILEELAAVEDAPDEQASVLLDGLLWPGEPLGRDIAGAPRSIGALSTERLRGYYRSQYVANAVVISIAGALPAAEARERTAHAVAGWPAGEPAELVRAGGPPPGPGLRLLEKDTEQAHLGLGCADWTRGTRTATPSPCSRSCSARGCPRGSSSACARSWGSATTYTAQPPTCATRARSPCTPASIRPTPRRRCARSSRRSPACDRRSRRPSWRARTGGALAHPAAAGGHAIGLAWHGSRLALGLPLRQPEEAIASFERVTLDDVERVARRLVRADRLQLAAIGPIADASVLEEALQLAD